MLETFARAYLSKAPPKSAPLLRARANVRALSWSHLKLNITSQYISPLCCLAGEDYLDSSSWELKAGVAMSWSLKQWFASTMFLRGFSNRFTLASLWEIVWSEEVHQSCDVLRSIYKMSNFFFFNFFFNFSGTVNVQLSISLVVLFTSTSRLASLRSSGSPTPLRFEMSFIVMTQGFCEDMGNAAV